MFFRSDQPFTPHHFSPQAQLLPGRGLEKKPKIIFSRQAYSMQYLFVDEGTEEVGWLGTAVRLENGDYRIDRVWLYHQRVSPTETIISTHGLEQLANELLADGDQGVENWNNLRFWGHSHVRMETFASGTDENTMVHSDLGGRSWGAQRFCFQDTQYPWAIRGIFNKLGKVFFSIFDYEKGVRIDDVAWEVDDIPDGVTIPTTYLEPARRFLAPAPARPVGTAPPDDAKTSDAPSAAGTTAIELSQPGAPEAEQMTTGIELGHLETTAALIATDGGAVRPYIPPASTAADENDGEVVRPCISAAPVEGAAADENALATTDSATHAGDAASSASIPWYKRPVYTARPPRARRYIPDITAAMRSAVQADFTVKVKSNGFSFFRSDTPDEQGSVPPPPTAHGDGVPVMVEGEASGPGTTGDFRDNGSRTETAPSQRGSGRTRLRPSKSAPSSQPGRDGENGEEPGLLDTVCRGAAGLISFLAGK